MWYELRWGLSACLILTVALITMIFYHPPSTVHASLFFRTITVVPGTKCIANAYTHNHDLIAEGDLGFGRKTYLHMVDAVGVVHAVILRIQTLMLPVKLLVFSGH